MTGPSKRKGDKAELELAGILTDLLGVRVRRKLGVGRADDTGDIDGLTCAVQVKNYRDVNRAIREGMSELPSQVENAGAPFGVLFVRRFGGQWAAVMSIEDFAYLYRESLPVEKAA